MTTLQVIALIVDVFVMLLLFFCGYCAGFRSGVENHQAFVLFVMDAMQKAREEYRNKESEEE